MGQEDRSCVCLESCDSFGFASLTNYINSLRERGKSVINTFALNQVSNVDDTPLQMFLIVWGNDNDEAVLKYVCL